VEESRPASSSTTSSSPTELSASATCWSHKLPDQCHHQGLVSQVNLECLYQVLVSGTLASLTFCPGAVFLCLKEMVGMGLWVIFVQEKGTHICFSVLSHNVQLWKKQACCGYKICHPYPYLYPQIFHRYPWTYPWIYPYLQTPIVRTYNH